MPGKLGSDYYLDGLGVIYIVSGAMRYLYSVEFYLFLFKREVEGIYLSCLKLIVGDGC